MTLAFICVFAFASFSLPLAIVRTVVRAFAVAASVKRPIGFSIALAFQCDAFALALALVEATIAFRLAFALAFTLV